MQLQHYAWVLKHWLSLILLGVLLCTAATFAVSFLFRPNYQAIALIQVNGSPSSTTNDVYSNQALAVADSLLITSTDVLLAASQKLPETSLDQLIAAVSASPKNGTAVIEVRASARDAQQAASMANTVTDTFVEMQITNATANLNAYAHELSQDVDAAKNNLLTAQQQLLVLQQSRGATADAIQKQKNQVDWYQASYNTLLATYRQTQLQLLQANNMLTVAQRALPPATSIWHRVLLNSALAAGISLLLMLTLAIVLDWLDTTLKTPRDVQQLAKLAPLGSMPQSSHPLRLPTASKALPARATVVEQALIIIGASFKRLYRDQKIVLVTSLHSGAGVTTTVGNLALLLAQSGTRVLIVDANQRRPGLSELFNLSLADRAADSMATDPALQTPASWLKQWSTPLVNLWCMPVSASTGIHQPLAAQALGKLLRALLQQAAATAVDIILLDAPALEEEADALALASIADGTLLVVAAGRVRAEQVRQAQAVLQRLGAPLGSVLINRQKVTHRSYFYTLSDDTEMATIESLAPLTTSAPKSARPVVGKSEPVSDHSEAAAQKQAQVVTERPSNNSLEITR